MLEDSFETPVMGQNHWSMRRSRHHETDRVATRARRTERREQLLEAALEVIRREGSGASMQAMAARAGITKPVLYRYFGDRDGLLSAVAGRFADELVSRLEVAFARHDTPRRRLKAGIETYIDFISEDPSLYAYLAQRVAGSGPALLSVADRVGALVARTIGEGLREAGADTGPAEPWAYGLVGMVHLAGARWVTSPTMSRRRLVEYLLALVWDGLVAAGRAD